VSVQAAFAATLVDEWVHLGVTDAVVCPGSRSTPLALALHDRLRIHVRLDERSAGFYALGLAMATGRPSVLCVTSGTAAAEPHPAVVEAHYGRIPLIVCTADRPPELHDTGAPQTIDQEGLFTTSTRWAAAPGVPATGQEGTWRPLAVRAFAEARQGPSGPGPVHLNLAFREPLGGEAGTLPPQVGLHVAAPLASAPGRLPVPLTGRGIVVAGGLSPAPPEPEKVLALARELRWPVLADPLSRCRVVGTIAAADAIVRTGPPLPETVLLVGAPWLSKALAGYVSEASRAGARIIVLDPWRQWPDPARAATEFHHGDPDAWLAGVIEEAQPCDGDGWLESWTEREEKAQAAIAETLGTELNEPQVARAALSHAADTGASIVVSASMPIRDLEWFAPAVASPPRVFANRGANGIDGVVSTALGVAASQATHRTIALMGDLAFLHDVSGLVNVPDVPCTFVVPDNGGGGIFSFLPQAEELGLDTFERLFGTPPSSDLGAVARGFGLSVVEVSSLSELEASLSASPGRPAVVRVQVPGRAQNAALHQAVNEAVRRALT
jgi:2-succinyl-5-enolpyruvyl-6-hydroxy-3-cyclohexene-1-carboxylate synthase